MVWLNNHSIWWNDFGFEEVAAMQFERQKGKINKEGGQQNGQIYTLSV